LFLYAPLPRTPLGDEGAYWIIGPWRERYLNIPDAAAIDAIIKNNNIPYHLHIVLATYLDWVPRVSPHSWETLLHILLSHLFGGKTRIYHFIEESGRSGAAVYRKDADVDISIHLIEGTFKNENALLKAVSAGDADKALSIMGELGARPQEEWSAEKLRNAKDYVIVLNTLLRKAVKLGHVHPAHIDALSSEISRRIENSAGMPELIRLVEMMILRYCDLVKKFSLSGCSPLIRKVINAVDFNLSAPLSLSALAEQFNAAPSNLSAQFKREKGMPLTGYINSRRLELAEQLLRTSGLYVSEIAEQCGFLDVAYFNRLFKRRHGVSPGEYRKQALADWRLC
jgi:AraC-like DNA-binding protein